MKRCQPVPRRVPGAQDPDSGGAKAPMAALGIVEPEVAARPRASRHHSPGSIERTDQPRFDAWAALIFGMTPVAILSNIGRCSGRAGQ